jgi:hypothetical protein
MDSSEYAGNRENAGNRVGCDKTIPTVVVTALSIP